MYIFVLKKWNKNENEHFKLKLMLFISRLTKIGNKDQKNYDCIAIVTN